MLYRYNIHTHTSQSIQIYERRYNIHTHTSQSIQIYERRYNIHTHKPINTDL